MPDGIATELWKVALAPLETCLTLEELVRVSDRSLWGLPTARAHLAGCARCQTELAMLKYFQAATTHPEEASVVSWITAELERRFDRTKVVTPWSVSMPGGERRAWWRRLLLRPPIRAAAFAFAALLAVVGVGLNLRRVQAPELASELAPGPEVLRSEELVVVGPSGDQKHVPAELRWQAVPGAARYRVKVMEVDRAELWQAELSQTGVSLPAAVRAAIVPGKTLLWQVTAIDATNKPVAASQILRFRLAIGASSSNH